MSRTQHRSAREVLEDHLREGKEGSIEADPARNYSPDLVVLTGRGVYHGHDGLRQLAELLRRQLPESSFEYRTTSRMLLSVVTSLALLACQQAEESATKVTMVGQERELRGTVVDAKLTACGPAPGKPGNCEGTLVVEAPATDGSGRTPVQVTGDVPLSKAGQPVFLPQLRGGQVVVKYRATREGANVAISVVGD